MKKTITPGFRIFFVALLSLCGITATSQVVINEYSCSNFESFPDNYDSFEDCEFSYTIPVQVPSISVVIS